MNICDEMFYSIRDDTIQRCIMITSIFFFFQTRIKYHVSSRDEINCCDFHIDINKNPTYAHGISGIGLIEIRSAENPFFSIFFFFFVGSRWSVARLLKCLFDNVKI